MTDTEQPIISKAPTCYRHPDRETWVSCGRCGKPLCPDCMRHGPVGVRCAECLYPQGKGAPTAAPENPSRALNVAAVSAGFWTIVLLAVGWLTRELTPTPNLLISAIAGGVVGWLLWRLVGRTWSQQTARWAWWLGAAMPLVAGAVLWVVCNVNSSAILIAGVDVRLIILGRILLAAGIAGLCARAAATKKR